MHAVALPGHHGPPARAGARRAARDPASTATTSRTVEAAIERVLAYHRGAREKRKTARRRRAPTMLRELLAPDVGIAACPMAERDPRRGGGADPAHRTSRRCCCAGSAATRGWRHAAAPARARRCSRSSTPSAWPRDGTEVLFVCFNRRLAEHLRRARAQRAASRSSPSTGSARTWRGRPEVKLREYPHGEAPPSYFDDELPDALVDAVGMLGAQYDALIVDEAQDLHDRLADGADAARSATRSTHPVWLFMDDNQNVYDVRARAPGRLLPVRPHRSTAATPRRSTARSLKQYAGEVEPEVDGPEGRTLELHPHGRPAGRASPE